MRILMGGLGAILLAAVLPPPAAPARVAASGVCEQLSSLALPGATLDGIQPAANLLILLAGPFPVAIEMGQELIECRLMQRPISLLRGRGRHSVSLCLRVYTPAVAAGEPPV